MTLPRDPTGYAVEESTGIVHKRYADHARGIRRTTEAGVFAILAHVERRPCPECWPRAKPARPVRSRKTEPEPELEVTSHSIDLTDTLDGS